MSRRRWEAAGSEFHRFRFSASRFWNRKKRNDFAALRTTLRAANTGYTLGYGLPSFKLWNERDAKCI